MPNFRNSLAAMVLATIVLVFSSRAEANEDEDIIARHMVAEALLAAHFVALAEMSGMGRDEIKSILRDVADRSAIDEFWITDADGHAYLTNTDIDFSFDPDPKKQPQAAAFWSLIEGNKDVVVQEARKREIDDQVFKYVAVAGIDKPRIVQVGVSVKGLPGDN